jgi:uncharacterized Tic20 family protein
MRLVSDTLTSLPARADRDKATTPHLLFGACVVAGLLAGVWFWPLLLIALLSTVWLWRRAQTARTLVVRQVRESLNVQLSLFLALALAEGLNRCFSGAIASYVAVAASVAALAQTCMAALRAYNGLDYRMPLAIRFLR